MGFNNKLLIKFIILAFLIAVPLLSIYAADPATYVLTRLADEIFPELLKDFGEGTLESRNQTELMKFQMRFWASQVGDKRVRDVVETAISMPSQIAGIDTYDIVDIIFDNWEDIYAGVTEPKVSGEIDPGARERLMAQEQVNTFKPTVPGPKDNMETVQNKLTTQRIALDDHFSFIRLKYFDKAVNDQGQVVDITPVENSIPEYIQKQSANLDKLTDNYDSALSSANIAALLESMNKQLVEMHKTELKTLEALTDLNQSIYYLSISDAYTNIENEFERQSSR